MRKKYSLPIIVIICLLLYLAVLFANSNNTDAPDYTVFSTNKQGFSLFYDILDELSYPVVTGMEQLNEESNLNDIHIIMQPQDIEEDSESILQWVQMGGRLIYIDDNPYSPIDLLFMDMPRYQQGAIKIYEVGFGHVLRCPAEPLTNIELRNERETAATILSIIDQWYYEEIVFDEYYHGYQYKNTMWQKFPPSVKIICYQLMLVTILLIIYFGKRFGRPIPYYEEIQRQEDEYLKTIAAIYLDAGIGNVAVDSRYAAFLRQCQRYFNINYIPDASELVNLWKAKNLPHLNELLQLQNELSAQGVASSELNTRKRPKLRKFLALMKQIDILNNVVKINY